MLTMEDSKDFTHLDTIFRQTFKDLPEAPAPSGWDTPSPHVWENIQTHLQASPPTQWPYKTLIALGAAAVILTALYWAVRKSTPSIDDNLKPKSNYEVAMPAQTGPAIAEAPATTSPETLAQTKQPQPDRRNPHQEAVAVPRPTRSAEPPALRQPLHSLPLPGSVPAPNTTIRRQLEELRLAPWAQPLQPLPARATQLHGSHPPSIEELLRPRSRPE